MVHSVDVEIERNYVAFQDMLAKLLPADSGRYALLRNQQLEGVFDSPGDAARQAFAKFGGRPYSIQLVTDEPVDLGFMTYAIHSGKAGQ